MKSKNLIHLVLSACAVSFTATAHENEKRPVPNEHRHEKKIAGPNGGRILTGLEPRAEFFVTATRKVQITFLDKDGKAVAPAAQVVTVTAGNRAAPTTLTFSKSGNVLLSNAALPAGNEIPTVVQIQPAAGSETTTHKFNTDLSKCGECKNAEYACVCGH
ncbi:MAG TPA: hypothetical protein VHO24_02115 [Opitutaceae bacterium]|nr:hypothetical protein [Opitutaceae bacterium]